MNARKPLITFFILSFLFISYQPASAKENKIGFVDFQKVFEKSTIIRKLNSDLEEKIKAEQQEIAKRQQTLEEKQKELEKKKALMNAEALTQKEEEIHQEIKDLKRDVNDKKEEFQRKGNGLMQKIMKELTKIVEEIGKDKGYRAIMERSTGGVVYMSPSADITEDVIKEYDKRNK